MRWGTQEGSVQKTPPCKTLTSPQGKTGNKTRTRRERAWTLSWWGEGAECSQGRRRAAGASASGAWELGGGPQDWRGELQEAGGGPQELQDELQEEGGEHQEAGDGSLGRGGVPQELLGAPLGPGGELLEMVGAPLGPGGALLQMGEGGHPGLEGGRLGLEGGPREQGDEPQMLVGGPLGLGGGPQEPEGGPQTLVDGPRELGAAAGEGPGALRVQAHWVAWGAEAGLLVGVEAKTRAVAAVGANHSSVGAAGASLQEARPGGSAGLVASPS